jgi:hypothetical protein
MSNYHPEFYWTISKCNNVFGVPEPNLLNEPESRDQTVQFESGLNLPLLLYIWISLPTATVPFSRRGHAPGRSRSGLDHTTDMEWCHTSRWKRSREGRSRGGRGRESRQRRALRQERETKVMINSRHGRQITRERCHHRDAH